MSAANSSRERAGQQQHGLLYRLITLPIQLAGALLGSLLLSILIECIGVHFFWPEEGWHHAERMFHFELEQISTRFTRSVLVREPARTAQRIVSEAYDATMVRTGLANRSSRMLNDARNLSTAEGRFSRVTGVVYEHAEIYALAAVFTALTFLVRLIVLCLTLPLLALTAVVGLIDGLVRRDIRRFSASYESGFVFHRAKASLVPIMLLPCVGYLSMPISVHPLFLVLPGATLLGLAINLAAGSFKKYI